MVDIVQVGLSVDSRSVDKGTKSLNKLGKEGKKTQKATDKMSSSFKLLGTAIAAIGVIALTKSLIEQINTYTALSNKLKLVTTDSKNLADVQNMLFDVAQDTRASLEGTIDLYSRLARSTKELGLSQNDLADVTETINQAIAVSGATAQEASAALFQLGQGLSAGALRGEELNSVMEQTPRLAQAIADGLGVGIAQLRVMGAAGELNAERVITALKRQATTIADEFNQTEKTIAQALLQIENVALQTFGALDGADMVESLDEFRQLISDPEVIKGLQTIASLLLDAVTATVKLAAAIPSLGRAVGKNIANTIHAITSQKTELEKLKTEIKNYEVMQSRIPMGSSAWNRVTDKVTEAYIELKRLKDELGIVIGDEITPPATNGTLEEKAATKQLELDMIREKEMDATLDRYIREEEQIARDQEYTDRKFKIQQDYHERLYNMERGSLQAGSDFAFAIRMGDIKGALQTGALMLANSAKTNKTAFAMQKAFALANAVVTLPSAVMKSFDNGGGYPWGLIPAGLMLAQGLQQISAIRSSSFSGGASAPSVGGGSSAPPASPSTPFASTLPRGAAALPNGGEQVDKKELRVTVESDGPHSEGMRKFAENLAETIKDMGGVGSLVIS